MLELRQSVYDILAETIENKFQREAGGSETMTALLDRDPSVWFPNWWKKFFGDWFAGRLPSQFIRMEATRPLQSAQAILTILRNHSFVQIL